MRNRPLRITLGLMTAWSCSQAVSGQSLKKLQVLLTQLQILLPNRS